MCDDGKYIWWFINEFNSRNMSLWIISLSRCQRNTRQTCQGSFQVWVQPMRVDVTIKSLFSLTEPTPSMTPEMYTMNPLKTDDMTTRKQFKNVYPVIMYGIYSTWISNDKFKRSLYIPSTDAPRFQYRMPFQVHFRNTDLPFPWFVQWIATK